MAHLQLLKVETGVLVLLLLFLLAAGKLGHSMECIGRQGALLYLYFGLRSNCYAHSVPENDKKKRQISFE